MSEVWWEYMTDFSRLRDAVRANPDLPLTWQQVIRIDDNWNADPEKRQKLIGDLERIQATETGQQVLREILLNPGRDGPVSLSLMREGQPMPGNLPLSTRAAFDNGANTVYVGNGLYNAPELTPAGGDRASGDAPSVADPEQPESGPRREPIRSDQYLLHELKHAARNGSTFYADAGLQTKQDEVLLVGEGERIAEEAVDAYDRDTGSPPRQGYLGKFDVEKAVEKVQRYAAGTQDRADAVEQAVSTIVKYAKTELRLSDAETLQFLDRTLQDASADGNDFTAEAQAFLRRTDGLMTDAPAELAAPVARDPRASSGRSNVAPVTGSDAPPVDMFKDMPPIPPAPPAAPPPAAAPSM
jgi:hypothetical protein